MRRLLLAIALIVTLLVGPAAAQTFTDLAVQPNTVIPPLANEYGPQAPIADGPDVDYASLLNTRSTHTFNEGIAGGDVVGAFRFICGPGGLKAVDPVVYFGGKGKSHLHQFYGNTGITENTTYSTRRLSGFSTCINILNRSGYWIPAMQNGRGKAVRPEYVSIYYKGYPIYRPQCQEGNGLRVGVCVPIPHNLAMIFGYDMLTATVPTGSRSWKCLLTTNGQESAGFDNMVDATKACLTMPTDNKMNYLLVATAVAPSCWDGKNLDSANHRSHVAYEIYDDGNTGRGACPKTHPYSIPHFQLAQAYRLDDTADFSGEWHIGKANVWNLSSDAMPGMVEKKPGSTLHADFTEGWSPVAKKTWHDNCINKGYSCSAGDLGDGTGLKPDSVYAGNGTAGALRIVTRPKMANEDSTIHLHAPK